MKTLQMVLLIAASFGTGFLIADGLAQAAPELQLNPAHAPVEPARIEAVDCGVSDRSTTQTDTAAGLVADSATNQVQSEIPDTSKPQSELDTVTMPLELYSAVTSAQQLPATELILQVDATDFEQMLELQRQDYEYSAQSDLYQQQLSEFMAAYPSVVQTQALRCGSRFCLMELKLQDMAAWPTLFKTLTAQQWWQSISYQNSAEQNAEDPGHVTLLLQQDWVPESNSQNIAVADGGQFE